MNNELPKMSMSWFLEPVCILPSIAKGICHVIKLGLWDGEILLDYKGGPSVIMKVVKKEPRGLELETEVMWQRKQEEKWLCDKGPWAKEQNSLQKLEKRKEIDLQEEDSELISIFWLPGI